MKEMNGLYKYEQDIKMLREKVSTKIALTRN
jgi:hypothetical protein